MLIARAAQDLAPGSASSSEGEPPHTGSFDAVVVAVESDPARLIVDPVQWTSKGVVNRSSRTYSVLLDAEAAVLLYPSETVTRTVSPGRFRPSLSALTAAEFVQMYQSDSGQREALKSTGVHIVMIGGVASTVAAVYSP